MTNKPRNQHADEQSAAGHATAVDDVRTKQEVDAASEKRQAAADLAQAKPEAGHHSHPKQHKPETDELTDEGTGEPVVEDEP